MTRIWIRPTEAKDREPIRKLMNSYIFDFYHYPKPEEAKLDALIDLLVEQREGIQFVAGEDEELVGFATLYFTYSTLLASKVVLMNDLFVKENKRGCGIGTKLFNTCYQYAAQRGYPSMTWETHKQNTKAQKFYEKMGAERDEWYTYWIKPMLGVGD